VAADTLRMHNKRFSATLQHIISTEGSLHAFCFANGLHRFGLHRSDAGWHFREWAPAALACSLVGDFNEWDPTRHVARADCEGVFHGFIPYTDGLHPGDRYKLALTMRSRVGTVRIVHILPAWARCTQQVRASSCARSTTLTTTACPRGPAAHSGGITVHSTKHRYACDD